MKKFFFMVEDVIKLLYFAEMFTLLYKYDFWPTGSASSCERERCLAYTSVNDVDEPEAVSDMDLTLISVLGHLIISKLTSSSVSHQNALQFCVEHARLWLSKSDQPIGSDPYVTCILTFLIFM